MARLTPRFSANRTVREYTEQRYLPAAAAYRERAANKGERGRQVLEWLQTVDQKWGQLRFGEMRVDTRSDHHDVEVEVFLGDLDPASVRVELYANGINGGNPIREEMTSTQTRPTASRGRIYRATVPAARPASDYTTRVIPKRPGVAVPLESAHILWQR